MCYSQAGGSVVVVLTALAEFVSRGLAVPPAPREFMADQMPGAAKLHKPKMVTL